MALTKRQIDTAVYEGDATKNEACYLWDDDPQGFGLRIYPSSKKSFVLNYRHNNRKRLLTIGQYGALTLDFARKAAKKHLTDLASGTDPLETRQKARLGETIKDLCAVYVDRHAILKKSGHEDVSRINRHILPAWSNLKATNIKRADVSHLHSKVGKINGHYEANRLLALLSKMFQKAQEWGIIEAGDHNNPAHNIERFQENKRDRYVTPQELPRLVEAIEQEPNQSARFALWLYLLTGLRKEEVLTLKWTDIDFDRNELVKEETKNGKKHYLPLSAAALALLKQIPRYDDNPYLIAGKIEGQHLVNVQKAWTRIRKNAGIEDVHIHDLRRTVGSWLAQSGNSLHLIGKVLNHSNVSTTAIYARFGQDNVREALEQHGQKILGVAGLTPKADVIPLKKAQ